ncbi:zinc ribbon domain-containing protein [Dickeya zeae]|nr:zinc ribbon domain-containing protein [Dickeya zeae]
MALTKCKECKKEVSTSARVCPHCGTKNPSTTTAQAIGSFAVLVLLIWGATKSSAETMIQPLAL